MTSRSGFCRRRSIRNGTPFSTAEGKGQSSPLLFMHPCCSLTGALHAPTTLNVCGMLIFRALGSILPPEHTLRRACHCVHIVSNYNVAIIVRCTGQHTDINSNSMQGLQMSPCACLRKTDKKTKRRNWCTCGFQHRLKSYQKLLEATVPFRVCADDLKMYSQLHPVSQTIHIHRRSLLHLASRGR